MTFRPDQWPVSTLCGQTVVPDDLGDLGLTGSEVDDLRVLVALLDVLLEGFPVHLRLAASRGTLNGLHIKSNGGFGTN